MRYPDITRSYLLFSKGDAGASSCQLLEKWRVTQQNALHLPCRLLVPVRFTVDDTSQQACMLRLYHGGPRRCHVLYVLCCMSWTCMLHLSCYEVCCDAAVLTVIQSLPAASAAQACYTGRKLPQDHGLSTCWCFFLSLCTGV